MLPILLYLSYAVARLQVTNMALLSAYSNSCIMLAILLRYLRYAKTRSFDSDAASHAYCSRISREYMSCDWVLACGLEDTEQSFPPYPSLT